MGALVLALVRPQIDVVTTASFGLVNHGIEQHPANALAPSLGKHVDQAQEPQARNHFTPPSIRPERVDERHRYGFSAVAADQKPRGSIMTSGIVEARPYLSDASWPRRPTALTTREVRALVDHHRVVNITTCAERHADGYHTGLPACSSRSVWLCAPSIGRCIRLLRSEEHTSELQSLRHLVCRLLLEKKKFSLQKHCWKAREHGSIGLHEALMNYYNLCFYPVGKGLDHDNIAFYRRHHGLRRSQCIQI